MQQNLLVHRSQIQLNSSRLQNLINVNYRSTKFEENAKFIT